MAPLGVLLLLVGGLLIRQLATGRAENIREDARDAFLAVVTGKFDDLTSIASRTATPKQYGTTGTSADVAVQVQTMAGSSNAGEMLLREMIRIGKGRPYVWGATGPNGYDCSGLVWRAMKNLGIYNGVRFTTDTFPVAAKAIGAQKVSTPSVGDVVVWSGHMGVVSGPGMFFSALSKRSGIKEINLNFRSDAPSCYRLKDTAGTHSQN